MHLEIVYTPEARDDMASIFWYIAAHDPGAADRYIQEIRHACGNLALMPHMGIERYDLRQGIRIFPFNRRVIIVYEARDAFLNILRVFHKGRDYETLLRE